MPPPCNHTTPRIRVTGGAVTPDPPMGADGYCGICAAAAINPQLRKRWGLKGKVLKLAAGVLKGAGPEKPARVSLPVREPCVYEGPVTSSCTSCNKAVADANHERACNHPTADRDTCTRDNAKSTLTRCSACPDYAAATGSPAPRTTKT